MAEKSMLLVHNFCCATGVMGIKTPLVAAIIEQQPAVEADIFVSLLVRDASQCPQVQFNHFRVIEQIMSGAGIRILTLVEDISAVGDL